MPLIEEQFMGEATKLNTDDSALRQQLSELLRGGSAHADLDTCLEQMPPEHYASKPQGVEYSAWDLLEHLRFSLHDLLVFSTDSHYIAPKWPDDYWPENDAPESPDDWKTSLKALKA